MWELFGVCRVFSDAEGFTPFRECVFFFDGETTATRVQVSPHRPGIGGLLPEAESLWEAH